MLPLALQDAPAHVQEPGPGQDAQRQTQTPYCQVRKGVQMRTPRPLQVPGQVSITARLDALLGDVRQPVFTGQDAVESVGLENTEGKKGNKTTNNQVNSDRFPARPGFAARAGVLGAQETLTLFLISQQADRKRSRQKQRQREDVDFGSHRQAVSKPEGDAKPQEMISYKMKNDICFQRFEIRELRFVYFI